MTNPNASPVKKNKSRSSGGVDQNPRRKGNEKGSTKGNGGRDDLITPDSLRKVLNSKPQPDMDVIPTRDVGINPLDLLQRRDNVDNLCKYNNQNPPRNTPSQQRGQENRTPSPPASQRWAGASFSNSPAANSLPQPSTLFLGAASSEPTARRLDFGEAPTQPLPSMHMVPQPTEPLWFHHPVHMPTFQQPIPIAYPPMGYEHHMGAPVHPAQPPHGLTDLSQHLKFMLNIRA
ncbi:hypothetical protein PROFUN_13276 [Planoprotostelium fungivorum]|uniref:Uncharacterized protein n=1 Tax=Planoprotostelium fungivorum TaxID=1890364 RepID=A0A2P6N4T8_9EUKA|nr:hypothetical protein PROFUN_13276 [Planoprotostelium fungivorum]